MKFRKRKPLPAPRYIHLGNYGPTVEQRMMREAEDRRWVADLPAFGSMTECPKCVSQDFNREYQRDPYGTWEYHRPHLLVTCTACGYCDYERCADWEEAA